MHQVCPLPIPWTAVHELLQRAWADSGKKGEPPPRPFVLSGWNYSNDLAKLDRWSEIKRWAEERGFHEQLYSRLAPGDFYLTEVLFDGVVGPLGGPILLPWNGESRPVPSEDLIETANTSIRENWNGLVGSDLAVITNPLRFTGRKKRRLVVGADFNFRPPWGNWHTLGREPERRSFTALRKAVNELISPHEVDHIDFTPR